MNAVVLRAAIFAAFVALCSVNSGRAQSVTLHPSADTTLFENNPDNNLGGFPTLAAGTTAHGLRSRAVIKFNLAGSIPSNAVIASATLKIAVVQTPLGGGEPSTFSVYRVLKDWGEGNKAASTTGLPATSGEATWNHRFFPSVPWGTPGAAVGIDYSEIPSSSTAIGGIATYTFPASDAMNADVAHWLSTPAQNFGWILISDDDATWTTARRFGARESSIQPELQIDYTTGFKISNIDRQDTTVRMTFTAEASFKYTVEYRPNVASGAWSTLTNITAKLASFEAVATDSTLNAQQRYYRIRKEPCFCD